MADSETGSGVDVALLQSRVQTLEQRLEESRGEVSQLQVFRLRANTAMATIASAAAVTFFFARSEINASKRPDLVDAKTVKAEVIEASSLRARTVVVGEGRDASRVILTIMNGQPVLQMVAADDDYPSVVLGLSPHPNDPGSPTLSMQRKQGDGTLGGMLLQVGRDLPHAVPGQRIDSVGHVGSQIMFLDRGASDRSDVTKASVTISSYPSVGASLQLLSSEPGSGHALRASLQAKPGGAGGLMLYGRQQTTSDKEPQIEFGFTEPGDGKEAAIIRWLDAGESWSESHLRDLERK